MEDSCKSCGGTGDKFDKEKNDWVYPWEKCPDCRGTGERLEDEER
jgi:DnaJ-class molecular chaperone